MKFRNIKHYSFLLILLVGFSCSQEETVIPEKVDIVDAVFASGQIVMEHEYQVTSSAEGYLVAANISEGDSVKNGMPLFQLSNEVEVEQLTNAQINYQDALRKLLPNSPEQAQLKLQIEQAQVQLDSDKSNYERYEKLVKSGAVSKVDFDRFQLQYESSKRQIEIHEESLSNLIEQSELQLKNAEMQLNIKQKAVKDFYLSSAISGVVLQLFKEQGELVRRGETLAKVGGGKPLAKLFIAEEDINRIALGQKVAVALNTDPNNYEMATIYKIYPSFDEQSQSFICEAKFDKSIQLFANTQLQANIIIGKKQQTLAIPSEYLLEGDSVLTKGGGQIPVNVGIRNNEWVEVVSGISERDEIKKQKKL